MKENFVKFLFCVSSSSKFYVTCEFGRKSIASCAVLGDSAGQRISPNSRPICLVAANVQRKNTSITMILHILKFSLRSRMNY